MTPESLARACVNGRLRYRDARALFDALYCADALVLSRGNVSAAAARAGIQRASFNRIRNRQTVSPDPDTKGETE